MHEASFSSFFFTGFIPRFHICGLRAVFAVTLILTRQSSSDRAYTFPAEVGLGAPFLFWLSCCKQEFFRISVSAPALRFCAFAGDYSALK